MQRRDPLAAIEQEALFDLAAAIVRHDLRNRLGAIRNAAFFLERRTKPTELWTSDGRVPRFFGLIESEVIAGDALLDTRLSAPPAREEEKDVSVSSIVALAVEHVRTDGEAKIAVEDSELTLPVNAMQIAVALRCLLENAIEAGASASVRSRKENERVSIEVDDRGPGLDAETFERAMAPRFGTKPGHAGLGLNVADRLVRRWNGELLHVPRPEGARIALVFPVAPPAPA